MNITTKLILNSLAQISSRIVSTLTVLAITFLITRNLSKSVWGDYVTITSYIALFSLVADFGLNGIIVKKNVNEEDKAQEYFQELLGLRVALSIISIFLALAVLTFVPHNQAVKLGIIVGLLLIFFQALFNTSSVVFQMKKRYDQFAFSDIVGSLTILMLVFLAIRFKISIVGIIMIFVIGNFVKASLGLTLARRLLKFSSLGLNFSLWRSLLIASLPLGLMVVLSQINSNIDKQIIPLEGPVGGVDPKVAVGIYGLAYRIFDFGVALPTYLVNAAYPSMLASHKEDKEIFAQGVRRLVLWLFGGGLVLTIIGFIAAPFVMPFFGDYAAAAAPLRILLLGLPFFFVTSLLLWTAVTLNKEILLPFIYGFAVLINISLNLVLIPRFGYNSAAWVTVITEIVILSALLLILSELKLVPSFRKAENPLPSTDNEQVS